MNRFYKTQSTEDRIQQSGLHICTSIAILLGPYLFINNSPVSAEARLSKKPQRPFVETARYNPDIPTLQSIIGHDVGEKAIRYRALAAYLHALAKSSERVRLLSYGRSHEGRTLYYLTITSPANHKRLDQIKAGNAKLSDPRTLQNADEANRLIDTLPAVAWMNYSIHGDELSSTDAALFVAYHLTAAQEKPTRKLLDETIVLLNPLVNPDGRERYLSHLEQLTGAVASPDYQAMQHQALWSRGRGNHYLFDLNRDWLVHIQPEVRPLAEVILSWNPHLLVDSHEQNAYDTYLFDPPRQPINIHLSPNVMQWRKRFGADQAEAFNSYGWSYYTKDWYSEWSPIYTNAWANLHGAIGLLYEQARVDAASIKHPTGQEISYRETVHHHIVSSLANLQTLHANRRRILSDFFKDRQWTVNSKDQSDSTFLLPTCKDTLRWQRLVDLINHQGIEAQFAQEPFKAENLTNIWADELEHKTLPEGTLVANSKQPRRRIFHALCAFDPHLNDDFLREERKELENRRKTLLYDVSSWNLPMAFGLEAYWAQTMPDVKLSPKPPVRLADSSKPKNKSTYGYLIDFSNSSVYPALVHLFDRDCHPRIAIKPFKIDGREYKRGTVLLRGHENPANLFQILQQTAPDSDLEIHGVDSALAEDGPDLGSPKFELLAAPRVAIASQWPVSSTSFGSVWYLLDHQLRLRTSPINIQSIGRIDLRKYNILILPDSRDLSRVLDKNAVAKIKRWVEAGGTLIAVGNAAAFTASKDRALSSVRLRRNVLDKLAEYEEAVKREKNARDIKIDPNQIWTPKNVRPETVKTENHQAEKSDQSKTKPDIDKLKRIDEWQRIFSPRGTFLTSIINTEHWLGFGLPNRLPVMFAGSYAFMAKHPVASVARLTDEEHLRLSGLLWPEARLRITNSAYATVESVGRGQIILFANDPTYRMWMPGAQRLFLNATLLGPGMGASQPLPW